MIRKKWRDGEVVLSVDTEDEVWKALATGEAVELTRELADQLGMMKMTRFPRPRRKRRGTIRGTRNGKAPESSLKPRSALYFI